MTAAIPSRRAARPRLFHITVAVVAMLIVFLGFAPSFYMRETGATPLKPVLFWHGLFFTAWMLLFLTQTALVSIQRRDLHRRLGWVGAVLAVIMVWLGIAATIVSLNTPSPSPEFDVRIFVMGPLSGIAIFAGLIGWAIAWRRRAEWHKRLMVMATISLLGPALARLLGPVGGLPLIILAMLTIVAAVMAFDIVAHRRLHPANAIGGAITAFAAPILMIWVAPTAPALALMDWLARL